jgi:hypothetical protein
MNYGDYYNATYSDDTSSVSMYDSYAPVSGRSNCAVTSEYQMNGMPFTPSPCNFTDDYAPVSGEYTATPIPVMAALQYYPWNNVLQVQDGKIFAPKIVDVQGRVIEPKQGGVNMQGQAFNQMLGDKVYTATAGRLQALTAKVAELQALPQTPVIAQNIDALKKQIAAINNGRMGAQMVQATSQTAQPALAQLPQSLPTFAAPQENYGMVYL